MTKCRGRVDNLETTDQVDQHGNPKTPYVYAVSEDRYWVRLPEALGRDPKWFAVGDYDEDPVVTYEAACRWRDRNLSDSHKNRVLRSNGNRRVSEAQRHQVRGLPDRQVTSLGKLGVNLMQQTDRRAPYDRGYLFAEAQTGTTRKNSPKYRRFSVQRYGVETALRYALRQRLRWESHYYGHRSRLTEDEWLRFMLLCYEQLGREKVDVTRLKHPGSVSEPDPTGLQARVSVRGESESAWFTYLYYGNQHEARVAAILWCIDNHACRNPKGNRRISAATKRNRTTGVPGVSRSVPKDRRGKRIVVYTAEVHVNGKRCPMKFNAGRLDDVTPDKEVAALAAGHGLPAHARTLPRWRRGACGPGGLAELAGAIHLSGFQRGVAPLDSAPVRRLGRLINCAIHCEQSKVQAMAVVRFA